jgi:negative regulator of PHO system
MRDGSFAEMISGVPLFRGRDNNDQLNAIIKVIGTPDDRTFRKIMQDSVRYLPHPLSSPLTTPPPQPEVQFRQLPKYPKQNFQTLLPRASPLAINLLEGLLHFEPTRRLSAKEALQHPYFREQQYTQLTNEQMQQAALVQQQQAQHQQAQAAQQQRLQQAQAAQAQAAAHQQGYAYSEFPDYSPRSCVDPFDRSKYLTATDGANAAIPGTSSTAGPRHAYD